MEYFKHGYQGHCGYLHVFPANMDPSGRYGYVGLRKQSVAALCWYFLEEPILTVLDKYYDESLQPLRISTNLKFDEYNWNYYTVSDAEAMTKELEELLHSGASLQERQLVEEFCVCMREVLQICEGYDFILFEGP